MRHRILPRSHFPFTRYIPERPSKVYGASPAIVFAPPGPMASIRRIISMRQPMPAFAYAESQASTTRAARKPNRGWLKLQAMMNGADDHIRGYDDGECERQSRGIH